MNNPQKQFLIRDNNTGKQFTMPKEGYESAKQNPAFHLWVKLGTVEPENVQKVWYVTEKDRIDALRNRKPFCERDKTETYFKILNRIDSNFIEGYLGHSNILTEFFSEIDTIYTYFEDYNNRKKIYFTFDKISLFEVTEIILDNPIKLIMKRLDNLPFFKKNTAFMIMPFRNEELDQFYEKHIREYLQSEFDIVVYRADNFTDNDVIIETIYNCIEESEFIMADTTVNNKNVFYELGYAVAKEKEVITIQNRSENNIFFDRAHVRSIIYSYSDIEKFKADLKGTILTIRSRM